jgi:YbgC/YbaW family acyl-CoA thioester hydrolase
VALAEIDMSRYSVEEYVRWEDIDAAGIINYQAYLRLFALAEVEMFRSCGLSYRVLTDEFGIWLPRVHVECDFFFPLKLDELLMVEAYFGKIGETSVQLNFEVWRKAEPERTAATGRYVLVAVRQGDFAPVAVPEAFRQKIARYAELAE